MIYDDAELIQHALEGDQQAFAALVEKYQKQIHALAWQKIGDFHIAQEITQDVFLTAYHKLATLKHKNSLAGWLYVITNRKCIAWHRKKKPQPQSLDAMDPVELEEVYCSVYMTQQREETTNQRRRELVQKLLSKLQESERTVVNLYYIAEMTCEEIAKFLGVSTNTVRSRLHRARNRLRKEETMLKDNLSSFQLPTQLTERIMQEISQIKPAAPTTSKPLVPWAVAAASAILIVLMIGMGSQYLARLQHPYSLESQSEFSVELIDAPALLNHVDQTDARNQLGVASDDDGKDGGAEQDSVQVLGNKMDYTQWKLPEGTKARFGKGGRGEEAFSPDGTRLAVASSIGIWIYDVETGKELDLLSGHTEMVNSISFSPDGRLLASGSVDDTIRLWDGNSGIHLLTLRGHTSDVNSVTFSPTGKLIASGSNDNTIRLWDVSTGETVIVFDGLMTEVNSVAFSPNEKLIASGSDDNTVRLWDVSTGETLHSLNAHTDMVNSVGFSTDGQILASGSDDNTVRLWDVNTGELRQTLDKHTAYVSCVAFSPDGKTLASGSFDTIHFWDSSGELLQTFNEHGGWLYSISFSPNGQLLACGSGDIWDVRTGELLYTIREHTFWILTVAFSPDGQTVASGGSDRTIRLWDVSTGELRNTLRGHEDRLRSISLSPDGQRLVSGSMDATTRLWDVTTCELLHTFDAKTGPIWCVAFSPDGQTVASGGDDNKIHLWDVSTNELLHTLDEHTRTVLSVSFSPDGRMLASGSGDGTVRLWDVSSGKELLSLKAHTNGSIAWLLVLMVS